MVKYHQLAIKESTSDQACMVSKMFLAVVVEPLFVQDTGNHQAPRLGFDHTTGDIKTISQSHHDVVKENPLKSN